MDIEQHPDKVDRVLVTIANQVEEDKIVDAFLYRLIPGSLFAFKHAIIKPWLSPSESSFPYTEEFPTSALGPIALEAFSRAGPDSVEGRVCDQMGQKVIDYLHSFRVSSQTNTEQPQP